MIAAIYERDGSNCCWCGRPLLPLDEIPNIGNGKPPLRYPTLDHLVPKAMGGGLTLQNLVVADPICNESRGRTHPAHATAVILESMREQIGALTRRVVWLAS